MEGKNARVPPALKAKARGHGSGLYSPLQDRPIEVLLRPPVSCHNANLNGLIPEKTANYQVLLLLLQCTVFMLS